MTLNKRDIFNIVAGRPLQGPENLVELKPDQVVVASHHKDLIEEALKAGASPREVTEIDPDVLTSMSPEEETSARLAKAFGHPRSYFELHESEITTSEDPKPKVFSLPYAVDQVCDQQPFFEMIEEVEDAAIGAVAPEKPSLLERISQVAELMKDTPDWKRGSARNTRKPFIKFKCMGDTGAIFPREPEHQTSWIGQPYTSHRAAPDCGHAVSQPEHIYTPGDLIIYYLFGWRTGHFVETNGHTVTIQPIGPKARAVMVPTGDTKVPKENGKKNLDT